MNIESVEPGWGDRDAGSWRARLRPLARSARSAYARLSVACRLAGVSVPRGDVRVSFGFPEPPDPSQVTIGGLVKVLALARAFPHSTRAFNVLYLVSSVLPDDDVPLARAAKRKGIALVVNQNGVAYPGWYGRNIDVVNRPLAELLRLADHVLYQSEFCRLAADEFLGVRPRSSEVLYNPVDTTAFSPASSRPEALTLLLAGYQAKSYRVRTAHYTLSSVARKIPNGSLIITGRFGWAGTDADARATARDWARALQVDDKVEMTGPYLQSDAPQIYRRSSLLLHTKYNDPCPTTVLEALACGLPVVYSATGGVPELVGPDAGIGVPGELRWDRDVPPDPDALADAVVTAATRRDRLSDAARRRAVEHFDTARWLDRHRQVFAQVLAGGHRHEVRA
jgi:glycosyltransferase involved in cell wall biosynthesis